jgi:hypothetical protein
MRESMSNGRARDDVIEVRTARHGHVIVSRINYSQLERVRVTRARMQAIRAGASRLVDRAVARLL